MDIRAIARNSAGALPIAAAVFLGRKTAQRFKCFVTARMEFDLATPPCADTSPLAYQRVLSKKGRLHAEYVEARLVPALVDALQHYFRKGFHPEILPRCSNRHQRD